MHFPVRDARRVYISTAQRVVDPWTRNVRSIPSGTGSGFLWDDAGTIITNYHVINGASRVIGMSTAIYIPSGASAGIGFAVPIEHGKYTSQSLGIETDDSLNDALTERLGGIERGGYVVPGDVIVDVDGKAVTSVPRLEARLDDFRIGQRVKLGVLRGGKRISVEATLGGGG